MHDVKFLWRADGCVPCPSSDDVFLLCSCSQLAHFLQKQGISRLRLELLLAFFSLLAVLHVGCHCMQVHEFRGGWAQAPSTRCPLLGHRLSVVPPISSVTRSAEKTRPCSPESRLRKLTVNFQYSFRTSTSAVSPFRPTIQSLNRR